jgi:hypothetical protein
MSNRGIPDFDTRVAQIEAVAEAVAKFDNAELQVAAFQYLLGQPSRVPEPEDADQNDVLTEEHVDEQPPPGRESMGRNGDGNVHKRGAAKAASAKKQTLTFDKSLNFYSTSGELGKTLKEFTTAHPAKNVVQKAVVVVYWLAKEIAVPEITVDHVYSAFKTLEWRIPSNLLNTLQQAGSKNFLDTKKSTNIRMTTHGENLVEFQLIPTADA